MFVVAIVIEICDRLDSVRVMPLCEKTANLITSTDIVLVTVDVHAGGDLRRLLVQRKQHVACLVVESCFVVGLVLFGWGLVGWWVGWVWFCEIRAFIGELGEFVCLWFLWRVFVLLCVSHSVFFVEVLSDCKV